jgi:predicted ATPase/serine/threonine protein kinase/DNA-binding SARP family transcriptional activator
MLRIFLFGTPRFERNGEPITISRRKAVALLAYLTVTNQPQSRDALATMLWPDYDQSGARANLRRDLSRLRRSLGKELLQVDRAQAGIMPDAEWWLDVAQFERTIVEVNEHRHQDQVLCAPCAATLAEAVALYTGDFMAGFSLPDSPEFDDWQFFQAEGLRQKLADALQLLVDWYVSQQTFDRAIEYGRQWLALDPLHEAAQRRLMQLYAWSGQQTAALRQYQESVRLLQEELGVEPEEETMALYEQIKRRQLEPPVEPVPAPEARPSIDAVELPPQERFELQELMAIGGHAEVYRGRDRLTGAEVVIKRLKPELVVKDANYLERFVREGEALRRLEHPNIVHMLASFEYEGQQQIVMELVPGGSLRDLLDQQHRLPLERVLDVGLELADALARAHHMNIIHRDLKPDNVLLASDGTPRLTDFGLAQLKRDDLRLTQTGAVIGSPAYMSPEALHGQELDPASDVWSFGVLLYEMLAGRRPFEGEQLTPVLVSILQEPPPPVTAFRDDIPPALAALLERMLVKERNERISSMRQVAAELEAIRGGRHTIDSPAPTSRAATSMLSLESAPPLAQPSSITSARPSFQVLTSEQEIRFARSPDGVRIAYAIVGQGPVLVKAANWLSHLEYDWNSPVWRHWLQGLSRNHTLIRYDERGCGLSDWEVDDFSVDAWVRDLETVVDSLALERFPLLGISQGGAVAIAYAARHPERVSHLILYGSYARGWRRRELSLSQRERTEVFLQMVRLGWGQDNPAFRQAFTSLFIPEATAEQMHWMNELQRFSTSPENAVRFINTFYDLDVSHLAPRVTAPTLVLHCTDDATMPHSEGQRLAALIPGARFVSLESKNHILLEHEAAWPLFLSEVEQFLSSEAAPVSESRFWAGTSVRHQAPPQPLPAMPPASTGRQVVAGTPFVGRTRELAEIRELFLEDPSRRLLTLVGPGGIGKTRLAGAVAEDASAYFGNNVTFVPLAPLTAPDQILTSIAAQLHFRFYEDTEPKEQLLNYLKNRRMLLILDNFEHLLEGAPLVGEILEAAPTVKILVTTRERLNLSGETVYSVGGMEFPETTTLYQSTQELMDYSAVQLLLQRARMVRPDLELTEDDYEQIVRICRLVRGMPLALVLSAAWLELLSFREIAEEVQRSLDFLEGTARDLPDRQRSLRAVFDSSWNLLEEEQQTALAHLSVFHGCFTREAARSVTGASLRSLLALLHKSWLQRNGDDRFEVQELLRQYAEERLKANPDAWREARERHATYYAAYLPQLAEMMHGPQQKEAFAALDDEFENVRAAWYWLVDQKRPQVLVNQMLPALFYFCEDRALAFDLLQLVESARSSIGKETTSEGSSFLAILLTARAAFYRNGTPVRFALAGSVAPADHQTLEEAWSLPLSGSGEHTGFWATLLAYLYGRLVDRRQGLERMRELVPLQIERNKRWDIAFALGGLAQLLMMHAEKESDFEEASEYLTEALAIFEELGDVRESSYMLRTIGILRRLEHNLPEAIRYWQDAQTNLEEIGDLVVAADINWQIGDAYLQLGRIDEAFAYFRRLSQAYVDMGNKKFAALVLSKEAYEAVRYRDLDYARSIRERSLALSEEAGDLYGQAWSSWEMGEIHRVGGDLPGARQWYERARTLFEVVEDSSGFTFYHRALGDLALATGAYNQACREFQQSLNHARETSHDWAMAYALAGLGRAQMALREYEEARKYFRRALRRALRASDQGVTLVVLGAVTSLYAETGDAEEAIALGTLILEHPVSWRETREQVQATLDEIDVLSEERKEMARQRGRGRNLWKVTERVTRSLARVTLATAQKAAHSLPVQTTPFVGRQQELKEIRQLLMAEERQLLTIVGPGGIGKSRMAMAVTADVLPLFAHGVYFIPLASLPSHEHIIATIADRVGYHFFDSGEPEEQLLAYLSSKQMLLLMDNFEHLLDGAPLLDRMLERAPRLKILVTSRERLHLTQEMVYTLGGMRYPARPGPLTVEELNRYGAMQLFVQRARMVQPDFEVNAQTLQQIARICRLVQGMPLAIVLATGWLEMLSIEELADEIEQSLDVLEGQASDLPDRHRSVRLAFDYSWQRLSQAEQEAFATLSIFRGGFTRQAAKTVGDATLPILRSLVSKSLVTTNRRGRYEIHELLRQFAAEQLQQMGRTDEARQAHSDYYLHALQQREEDLRGRRQLGALDEIEAELENLRLAWDWALSQKAMETIDRSLEPLYLFFYMRSRYHEGVSFLTAAREALAPATDGTPHATWGRVLARLGFLQAHLANAGVSDAGVSDAANSVEADILQSLQIAEEQPAPSQSDIAFARMALGCYLAYALRDPAAALPHLQQSLDRYRDLNDEFYTVLLLIWVGYCYGNTSSLDNFNEHMRQALELARQTGNKVYGSNAISNLAAGAFCAGYYSAAESYAREALEVANEMGLGLALAHGNIQLALAHFLNGALEEAERLGQEGLAQALELNYANTMCYALAVRSLCASMREEYELAHEFGTKSVAIPASIFGQILGQWSLAVANAGLQKSAAASVHIHKCLELAQKAGYPGMLTWPLAVAARVAALEGQWQQASELLALSFNHPLSPKGWLGMWPALSRLPKQLEAEMGRDAYRSAWKRGQRLNLEDAISALRGRVEAAPG